MTQVILHPRAERTAKYYALLYAGLGWKVFPVWGVKEVGGERLCACGKDHECERPGKHPIADLVPLGLNDASNEPRDIERWWTQKPNASIGIRTGAESGITVVDADASGGKPGVVNLTALCARNGGMPVTFAVNTGGGGIHLYFKYSSALQTGTNVLGEAIDVRNDGGYVIAPPSLHILGIYKWRSDTAELLDLPTWMRPSTGANAGGAGRRSGRPRVRVGIRIEKADELLRFIDPEDRDDWLKVGVILGRLFVGTLAEGEAWALYESWSARSEKFDEHRNENLARMREMFAEISQAAPRAGQEPITAGSLFQLAREGGWTPFGRRAPVSYEPGAEASMCEQLIQALVADKQKNRFYNVSGEVRDIVRSPIPQTRLLIWAAERGETLPESIHLRKTLPPGLQCALSEVAVLATADRHGEPVAKPIPADLVNMMLRDRARDFPPLTGISEWPMVSLGGNLVAGERGYDEATGLFFDIDTKVKIERTEPEIAWKYLSEEVLQDFPFLDATQEAYALAMLLSFMQRPLMKTSPAFAVVAPQPGTGKTTLIEIAALAIHGGPIVSHAFSSEEEELRKALQALMMSKVPVVLFDNIAKGRSIRSDHLAKLITSETTADRILGSSDTRKEVNNMLLTFTGNNIHFVKDMASRVVIVRLNAKSANPLRRNFSHPDIRTYAMENRSRILSALVSIAALADGQRPPGNASRFEDYDTYIARPIQRLLDIDIRAALNITGEADADEDDTVAEALSVLWKWQQMWRGNANGEKWKVREIVEAVGGASMPEAAREAVRAFAGGRQNWERDALRSMSYALRAIKGDYMYAPYRVESEATKTASWWRIEGEQGAASGPTTDENGGGPV